MTTKSVAAARGERGKSSGDSITLELKIRKDGGPLFQELSGIKNAHLRCERVRQLLYLGLLRETEILRPATAIMGLPVAQPSPAPAPPVVTGVAQRAIEADVLFNPSDLGEWFTQ